MGVRLTTHPPIRESWSATPLVGMFLVLQCAWNTHCGNLVAKRITVDCYNFIPEYLAIQNKVVTPDLITKAFQKTGIFPFDPSIFSEQDFGPSMASSPILHLPSSYPNPTPSLPLAIPTDIEDSDTDFVLGQSSDMEMDSSDKVNSDNKECCNNGLCVELRNESHDAGIALIC